MGLCLEQSRMFTNEMGHPSPQTHETPEGGRTRGCHPILCTFCRDGRCPCSSSDPGKRPCHLSDRLVQAPGPAVPEQTVTLWPFSNGHGAIPWQDIPWVEVAGLGVGRCFTRASLMLMNASAFELYLQRVHHGNVLAAGVMMAWIEAIDTFLSFWVNPMKTALVDRYGRKTFMVGPFLGLAGIRVLYTAKPSHATYALYRTAVVFLGHFMASSEILLCDLVDPTSDAYTAISQPLQQCATVTGLSTLFLTRLISSPEFAMYFASVCTVAAALTVHFTVAETLKESDRRPVPWARILTNPLHSLGYFVKSPELLRLHVLAALWHIAQTALMAPLQLFRRQVYGWGMQQVAAQNFYDQMCDVVGRFGTLPARQTLGIRGMYFFGKGFSVLSAVLNLVAPAGWIWVTAIPWAFRYDVEGKGREDAYWRQQVGVPMSEGQTAHTTKIAIMQLFVPSAWVNFYAVTSRVYPRTFILVSLVAQTGLLIVTPFVWPDSAAHKRNKVTLAVEASVIGLYFSVVYCVVLYSVILRYIVQCIVGCCSALPCTGAMGVKADREYVMSMQQHRCN